MDGNAWHAVVLSLLAGLTIGLPGGGAGGGRRG